MSDDGGVVIDDDDDDDGDSDDDDDDDGDDDNDDGDDDDDDIYDDGDDENDDNDDVGIKILILLHESYHIFCFAPTIVRGDLAFYRGISQISLRRPTLQHKPRDSQRVWHSFMNIRRPAPGALWYIEFTSRERGRCSLNTC